MTALSLASSPPPAAANAGFTANPSANVPEFARLVGILDTPPARLAQPSAALGGRPRLHPISTSPTLHLALPAVVNADVEIEDPDLADRDTLGATDATIGGMSGELLAWFGPFPERSPTPSAGLASVSPPSSEAPPLTAAIPAASAATLEVERQLQALGVSVEVTQWRPGSAALRAAQPPASNPAAAPSQAMAQQAASTPARIELPSADAPWSEPSVHPSAFMLEADSASSVAPNRAPLRVALYAQESYLQASRASASPLELAGSARIIHSGRPSAGATEPGRSASPIAAAMEPPSAAQLGAIHGENSSTTAPGSTRLSEAGASGFIPPGPTQSTPNLGLAPPPPANPVDLPSPSLPPRTSPPNLAVVSSPKGERPAEREAAAPGSEVDAAEPMTFTGGLQLSAPAPGERGADSGAGQNPQGVPVDFAARADQVALQADARLKADQLTLGMDDGQGRWEADVSHSESRLDITLRGHADLESLVQRTTPELRERLAGTGFTLNSFNFSDGGSMSQQKHPGARREDAPAWPAPRTPARAVAAIRSHIGLLDKSA